jgi:hypothetical protein
MNNFKHRYNSGLEETLNINGLVSAGDLTNTEILRLEKIKEAWNFYEGYHWEGIDDLDSPQVTFNYCRPFVNKFVSFEFGKGFTIKTPMELEGKGVTVGDTKIDTSIQDENMNGVIDPDELDGEPEKIVEKTINDFLNSVWNSNNREQLCVEIGQTKSITGEAWVKVSYESPEDADDPFEEYPDGRMRITCIPTQFVFPEFNPHDKEKLDALLIMYPIEVKRDTSILWKRSSVTTVIYKEIWTKDEIVVYQDKEEVDRMENPYGVIPFVQIKNFPIAGRTYGMGDLDDIIPLNVELNTKRSDISEIIDYHSAPITCVFGAKIGNLEKGANKVWGGLPKDAKVANLELQGDLSASSNYTESLKTSMCEIGGVPETVLGGASAISNTSGVALQYMNLPLIEKTRVKRHCTKDGFEKINKMILHISLLEGLIEKPENISKKDFLFNEVTLPDTLPKDELIELQKLETEMKLGLECRHGALERMGREDLTKKLIEIDKERAEHPELFNPMLQSIWYQNQFQQGGQSPQLNSGMMNGQTPIEQVRTETTGQNGGGSVQ